MVNVELVALDANAWRSTLLLRSEVGAALRHFVHRRESRILLPEVTEREAEHLIARLQADSAKRVLHDMATLRALHGSAYEVSPPVSAQLFAKVVAEYGDLVMRQEMKLEHVRGALECVIKKQAPAHRREEFRDALLFAALLDCRARSIYLISEDKDFYEGGKYEGGMSRQLYERASKSGVDFRLYPSAADCLEELQGTAPDIESGPVHEGLVAAMCDDLERRVQQKGGVLGEYLGGELRFFATEKQEEVIVDFRVSWALVIEESEGVVQVHGEARHELRSGAVTGVRTDTIVWPSAQDVFLQPASFYLRREPPRAHRVRRPLQ